MTTRLYDVEHRAPAGGVLVTTVEADDSGGAAAAMAQVPGAIRVLSSRRAQPLPSALNLRPVQPQPKTTRRRGR